VDYKFANDKTAFRLSSASTAARGSHPRSRPKAGSATLSPFVKIAAR
jgi:hypothetical protein